MTQRDKDFKMVVNACKAAVKGIEGYGNYGKSKNDEHRMSAFAYGDYVVVWYDFNYDSAQFAIDNIYEREMKNKSKRELFNECMIAMKTNYNGFVIFDKDFNDVTDKWEVGE